MTCPCCQTTDTKVLRTVPGRTVSRHHECKKCDRRWWTDEKLRAGSIQVAHPQATGSPSVAPVISSPSPLSLSLVPSNPDQTPARSKPDADSDVSPNALARRIFIEAWEGAYGEKYAFEKKDGVALAVMLKAHPEFALDWKARVLRYLAKTFWGQMRHPLHLLATKAREFGAPMKNGTTRDVRGGHAPAVVSDRPSGEVKL